MQEYKDIDIDSLVSDGPDTINKNFKTLMSNNAGGEFPTENLYAGMMCYRSDEGKLYTLKNDLTTWVELFDISGMNGAVTPKADALTKTLTVAEGGTGATTGSEACSNIGAVQTVNDTAPDENGNVNVAGVPVGFEYFTTNPNIPAGSLPLFGGEYSRATYQDLWNWVQLQSGYLLTEDEWQIKSGSNDGNVPFYSTGDGTTTFRVPSLKCWVKGANGIEEVGSYLSAGLPILPDMSHTHERGTMNITGEITWITADASNISNSGYPTTGAFRWGNEAYSQRASLASGEGSRDLNFDASRSWTGETSSASLTRTTDIYGNSDTVQPKSIVGMWLVKAYGTITNVGGTDVSNIAQGLTELETRVTPIANGGTGATTASDALSNLGGVPTSEVANSANKIPRYNSSGHLVFPDSSEFWIA